MPAKQNPKDEWDDFILLLCGSGGKEDFEVKGYNIAVKAFADQRLKGKHCSLLFVGSPEGKQDEVQGRLLNCGIDKKQLTVREFVKSREKMKELFCEGDMVIMPSKSEGFGLVALEALSAGLPILVGSNSGFARAIEEIPFGLYSVVDSEDPSKWAEGVEGVRYRHRVVLQETKILREYDRKTYCWKTQCEELVDRLWKMVYGKVFINILSFYWVNIGFILVLKTKGRCIDSLLGGQISFYNEYEFCHLLHEWLYNITILLMIILLYNSYIVHVITRKINASGNQIQVVKPFKWSGRYTNTWKFGESR